MPTPLKPEIHPEYLAGDADAPVPLQNPSYAAFVEDLRQQGVLVFDATVIPAAAVRASHTTQYLATDTHWRPEAMEAVAEGLVDYLRHHVLLPDANAGYRVEPLEVRHLGDIAVMLDLPRSQTLYQPETTTIRRVLAADGTPWRPSRDADVLVLGDSFSNIYSLASMGWGEGAGLVEHVSFLLQRPVDRVVQNDQGAYATRELLRRGGEARLAGKRVVIYQFAARELMFGDWRVFE
jgi:alginate O-acetyltransferase complex protein AlgJ